MHVSRSRWAPVVTSPQVGIKITGTAVEFTLKGRSLRLVRFRSAPEESGA